MSFRNFRVDELTATSAVIRFDTSRPTTCEVEYGLDSDNLAFTATDPTMLDEQYAIEHRVPLFDLTPETTYYYRGMVVDPEGRVYRSELFVLTTPPGDGSSRPDSLALLSRGARVSAVSSNFGEGPNDGAWGANNAFDGKMGTEWASNGDGDDAFIEVYVFEFEGRYLAQRVRFEVDPSSGGNTGAREIELYSEGSE